jgi:hypothetical protein
MPSDPRTAQIRALIAGTLDVSASPQSLFDVPLDDEAALHIEETRVRALLRAVDAVARPPEPPPRSRGGHAPVETPDAGTLRTDLASVDPALWNQRVELDRARLEFYSLGAERRAEILRTHEARQQAARPRETEEERRARDAQAERARALEAAKAARAEAERRVSEEVTRLGALETRVRAIRDRFQQAHDDIALQRDTVLGWQRRVRDAKASGPTASDATYDALRRALRGSRDDLSAALDALDGESSDVPALGPDPLADIPLEVPTDAARDRRAAVDRAIAEARRDERSGRTERAWVLLDEITALNRERLGLLPSLSPGKRDAITGFTSEGWDQARSEARHLSLILRYHQDAARTWVSALRNDASGAVSPWRTAAVLVPLLVLIAAFLWVRRRTQVLLRWGDIRLAAADRAGGRTSPGFARRMIRILRKTHRPMEWLTFFAAMLWLLPSGARDLLEVQLVSSVIAWMLVGALVVNAINAVAARSDATLVPLDDGETERLRLRSLRLVGRTIVVFALILVLSARLVGEGTIYSWVFSTCWFAAIPIFLLLVRWWRGTVFERLDRVRKKTPLQTWILANRSGWKSFVAAMLGTVLLSGIGTIKRVRGWLSGFDLARRVHAYLFKRELERIGDSHAHGDLVPLSTRALEQLHPERPCRTWLSCPADELRDGLVGRSGARRGGLIAVVGARGMGKSSLLHAVAKRPGDAAVVECRAQTSVADLRAVTGLADAHASPGRSAPAIVLLDDAHALVELRIGGLARFDDSIAFARGHSGAITWVFAIDATVWPLLRRGRDARPMFDETHVLSPWNEGQIGALVAERCEASGISPRYDDLLDKLPPGADDLDRQDVLRAKRAGYERMLWDHVGGNPGLALEAWRMSLAQDDAGVVHVRPLQVPDVSKLERLPDSSLFVLRAVLQLAPTTVEVVAQATRLRSEEVLQDLRFGMAQGFYDEDTSRVRVAWSWLRAATRLLERRHLLVSP